MAYNSDLLRVIDSRIKTFTEQTTAVGTVVYRTTSLYDPKLLVAFDGSSMAVPVKAFGNVFAQAGDRVGLVRFGAEWVVVGTFTPRVAAGKTVLVGQTSGTTTSSSFAALPNNVQLTLVKQWDETNILLGCAASHYVPDTAGTAVAFAAYLPEISATYNLAYLLTNPASLNIHHATSGWNLATGRLAGTYTVQMMWSRPLGPGTPTVDSNDWTQLVAMEVGP